VDVLWHLIKDEHFGDNPPNAAWCEGMDPYQALVPVQTSDRPEVHDIVRKMRAVLDAYEERVLIGEIYLPVERLVQLFSLPGTPMIQYGDEIGMGEDLSLNEREATRTPMQWTDGPQGGFTRAKKAVLPVIDEGIFGYRKVNVNAQRRDPNSFMNWIGRLIRVRKECMEIAWGECEVLDCETPSVLVLAYRFRKVAMVTLHNFSESAQTVQLKVKDPGGERLVDLIGKEHSRAGERGTHEVTLDGYGYRWLRVGDVDETLTRAPY
jgi:maltose alpha-D-glucosyltransferase / alpha-amylase